MLPQRKLIAQLSNFDIRLLRVFRTVVDCGGFSAAEVELNISRSAISMSMSDLEDRLGLTLCRRGRAGFALTDEGRTVYQASLQLMTSLENFRTQVNSIHAELKGELSIGITDNLVTIEHMQVTRALKALKLRGPDVEVRIRMIPPNEIERSVLDGSLHFGVVPVLRSLPGLEYNKLYKEQSHLYCSAEHPLYQVPDEDISEQMVYECDAVAPAYAQIAKIKTHYQKLKTTATATDREGVAFLIFTGCFIGYLPTHFAKRWLQSGRMREIKPQRFQFKTEYQTVIRKGGHSNVILDTFLNEVLKKD
jgi:DNA-binding transcriptional LysR family regulator